MFVPRSYIHASPLCACILSRVAFLEIFPRLLSETNDWQFLIFLSSHRLKFQTNPTLKYLYPPPSSGILTNIVHTLLSVPKFYVQVSRGYTDFSLSFFVVLFISLMLGMCKHAHPQAYLLCISICLLFSGLVHIRYKKLNKTEKLSF